MTSQPNGNRPIKSQRFATEVTKFSPISHQAKFQFPLHIFPLSSSRFRSAKIYAQISKSKLSPNPNPRIPNSNSPSLSSQICSRPDLKSMSRRAVPSRRLADGGSVPLIGSLTQKSKNSPLLSVALVLVGAFLLIGYSYSGSGGVKESSIVAEGLSCTAEVRHAIPILKKAYGDSMHKVLHVGPETCAVVSELFKEDTEAWGVEPYDLEDADGSCKTLMHKGLVRVADIKFPLPYRPKSFSLVIVSDALDYLSPKYLNKTLPDLARVSSDGLVIFAGYPGQQRAKLSELSKFGRPAKLRSSSWWIRYFFQTGLEENEVITKKFEQAASKSSYNPGCQNFHLSLNN